jgi:hypothetical protein
MPVRGDWLVELRGMWRIRSASLIYQCVRQPSVRSCVPCLCTNRQAVSSLAQPSRRPYRHDRRETMASMAGRASGGARIRATPLPMEPSRTKSIAHGAIPDEIDVDGLTLTPRWVTFACWCALRLTTGRRNECGTAQRSMYTTSDRVHVIADRVPLAA